MGFILSCVALAVSLLETYMTQTEPSRLILFTLFCFKPGGMCARRAATPTNNASFFFLL
jgi:hypothetical protein